jgi:hypothetical protein
VAGVGQNQYHFFFFFLGNENDNIYFVFFLAFAVDLGEDWRTQLQVLRKKESTKKLTEIQAATRDENKPHSIRLYSQGGNIDDSLHLAPRSATAAATAASAAAPENDACARIHRSKLLRRAIRQLACGLRIASRASRVRFVALGDNNRNIYSSRKKTKQKKKKATHRRVCEVQDSGSGVSTRDSAYWGIRHAGQGHARDGRRFDRRARARAEKLVPAAGGGVRSDGGPRRKTRGSCSCSLSSNRKPQHFFFLFFYCCC